MCENTAQREAKIEELARRLKDDTLLPQKKVILEDKLLALVMEAVNLSGFAASPKEESGRTMLTDAENPFYTYDGEILAKVWFAVLKDYGKLDTETGEPIPFLKLFRAYWNRKKPDWYRKNLYVGFENQKKEADIRELLRSILSRNGEEKMPLPNNLFNESQVRAFILQHGGTVDDVDTYQELKSQIALVRENSSDTDENGAGMSLADMADAQQQREMEHAEQNADDSCDALLEQMTSWMHEPDIKQNKTICKFIRLFVTYSVLKQHIVVDVEAWPALLDKEFWDYAKAHSRECDEGSTLAQRDKLIADYVGLKPDTVRKRLKEAELKLLKKRTGHG